jgi:hypothetical protein
MGGDFFSAATFSGRGFYGLLAIAMPKVQRIYNPSVFYGGQRMFNTIFPKNFYKKWLFWPETDIRLWSI